MTLRYRLLATDLDGTASRLGQAPSPRVVSAIRAAQELGVTVIVATGRDFSSAQRLAVALGITAPLICFQGALVRAQDGDRAVSLLDPCPAPALLDLVERYHDRDLDLCLFELERLHVSAGYSGFYTRTVDVPVIPSPSLYNAAKHLIACGVPLIKGVFVVPPARADSLEGELRAEYGDTLNVVRSHTHLVEVMSPRASKGNALAHVAASLGIAQEETVAVGDSGNDASMIAWAGMGVAMGNATDDARRAARWVAPTVEEDGLADVINRFFLSGEGVG